MEISLSVCPVCFNLNPDRFPHKYSDRRPDESRIDIPFPELKRSAEESDCLACKILCLGLENIEEGWKAGTEAENVAPQILLTDTLLQIVLNRSQSLHVTLANVGYETTIEFYTLSNDDNALISAFGVARAVSSRLTLNECLALAAEWMNECNTKHPSCILASKPALPSRVLDVSEDGTDLIYLYETKDTDQGSYMTLSHCWGTEQIITTTISTLQDRKAGIKLTQLSKTFRHAVKITRGLGIRYLWIDSLCIIQDDKMDWEIESGRMAEVYMSSQLNLAATHAKSGSQGCFGERWSLDALNQTELNVGEDDAIEPSSEDEGKFKIYYRHALHVAHDHFTRSMDYAHVTEDTSPLLSRAWVFQERLLAPRTLHFHAEELIWECAAGISCECSRLKNHAWGDPEGFPEQIKFDQLKMMYASVTSPNITYSRVLDMWLEFVSEYCTLKITNQTDRLPALLGLASRIAKQLPSSEYLAGLWSQDLPRALCWQVETGFTNGQPRFRCDPSYAPSWSWASIWSHKNDTSSVTYGCITVNGFVKDSRCQVRSFHGSPDPAKPLGLRGHNWLKIKAPIIQARFHVSEEDRTSAIKDMQKGSAHEQSLTKYMKVQGSRNTVTFEGDTVEVSGDCTNMEEHMVEIAQDDSVICLLLGTFELSVSDILRQYPVRYLTREDKLEMESPSQPLPAYALLLRKVEDGSKFARVGLLIHRGGSKWWDNAEIDDITLT